MLAAAISPRTIALVLALALGYGVISESAAPIQPAHSQADDADTMATVEACEKSQSAVDTKLISPSSASFANCVLNIYEYQIRANPDRTEFSVVGYVDAENAFGAKLHRKFVVLLTKTSPDVAMIATRVRIE